MPELITCPSCSRQLRVPDSLIGKAVKCPSCNSTFTAGAGGETSPPQAPPAPWQEPPKISTPTPSGQTEEVDYDDEADDRGRPRAKRRRIRRDVEPHRGTLILVLGILGFVVCPFCGVAAWIMGNTDLEKIRSGQMDPEGEGTTQAGRVCGIIATILLLVQCVCGGLYVIFIFAMAGAGAAGGLK